MESPAAHPPSSPRSLDRAIEVENGCIGHFEVLTALAYTLFAKEKLDIAVIEAGFGGARDATNVIPSSGLATLIITTIDEEHLAALGGSLESIAMAKYGIMKHGCPVVLGGPSLSHIECILRDKALLMSSISCSIGIRYKKQKQDIWSVHVLEMSVEFLDLKLYMLGNHQLQNVVTATCAALCLRNRGGHLEVVICTEAKISGGKSRTTAASVLKNCSGCEYVKVTDTSIFNFNHKIYLKIYLGM